MGRVFSRAIGREAGNPTCEDGIPGSNRRDDSQLSAIIAVSVSNKSGLVRAASCLMLTGKAAKSAGCPCQFDFLRRFEFRPCGGPGAGCR